MTCEFKKLDTQLSSFIKQFYFCNQQARYKTKRDLKSRLAEHKLAIKNQEPEKSALCKHYMRFDHLIKWNNLKILKTEAHYSKRLNSEF